MFLIDGYVGNKPDVNAWGKSRQVTGYNALVKALVIVNKGASTVWIEIHDSSNGTTSAVATHADAGEPRYTLPLGANQAMTLANSGFNKGVFVRAVDAASAGALIATDDVKITCEFTTWPVSAP